MASAEASPLIMELRTLHFPPSLSAPLSLHPSPALAPATAPLPPLPPLPPPLSQQVFSQPWRDEWMERGSESAHAMSAPQAGEVSLRIPQSAPVTRRTSLGGTHWRSRWRGDVEEV